VPTTLDVVPPLPDDVPPLLDDVPPALDDAPPLLEVAPPPEDGLPLHAAVAPNARIIGKVNGLVFMIGSIAHAWPSLATRSQNRAGEQVWWLPTRYRVSFQWNRDLLVIVRWFRSELKTSTKSSQGCCKAYTAFA
jgi:hypothetical protein